MAENTPTRGGFRAEFRSLAALLTTWYAFASFTLVLVATVALYVTVTGRVRAGQTQVVRDRMHMLQEVKCTHEAPDEHLKWEIEHEWPGGDGSRVYVRIFDPGGELVTETHGMEARDVPATAFPPPREAGDLAASTPVTRSSDGRAFLLYAARLDVGPGYAGPLTAQLALDVTEDHAWLASYRRRMAAALLASLVLSMHIGHLIARRGLAPVRRFGQTLANIQSATLSERIDPRGLPSELEQLANTCNRMLDRLEESFARLSRFSADIAHELRTPLNNLCCGVGVGVSRPRTVEEYEAVLGSCLEDSQRLARLIDSLLFVARTEGAAPHPRKESLDLAHEAATVSEFYDALAVESAVELKVEADDGLVAPVDRALFQSAVGNLVENAIAATPPYGRVSIRASKDGDDVRVEVSDTGCGIPADHLPRVFDRLYRVDSARTGNGSNAGAGLGLSIVKGIMTLHAGTVSLESREGEGTTVTLRFPSSDAGEPCCPPAAAKPRPKMTIS